MGRSNSSKAAPDGQPQQHFEGSHVSPRDQVVARPPYDSAISRGTTRVRPGILTSSPPTGLSSLRPPEGQTDQRSGRGSPRKLLPTSEARHLSSTHESSITFLALEGGSMSQERPTSNPNSEHLGGSTHVFPSTLQPVSQAPCFPTEEASTILPTPNCYWRLFNDLGLTPPDPGLSPTPLGLGPPVMTAEAFLATIENLNASVSQPTSRSRNVMHTPLEPDVVSSDSTNSVREQLCQVNQRLDEVQRDFVRSKEEVGETTKGGSPFALEILDKPIPSSFRLPTLEPYDRSTDPTEHVAVFRAQMALYDTSDALMCHTFPMTLRGSARMWYNRMKSSSISSFDQFAKKFELNFIASSCPRATAASLLGLTQGNDEPLAQFVSRFLAEIRRMPDTHPTLAIQAFLMGLRPSRFYWSLIERPPSTVPKMLQRASQYVATEFLLAEKREDHKKSRGDKPQ
ncbi:hypothetical protein B296_00012576 [Ensete ventricosum]|uniref:Retrotransposon gag domain-containing protein n=1 Tax=Ensete ventricosum TaxID=4639 RepID=A0A427AP68_ENSVE|nr:hypothetical protein B296_00012576 [Ensete ventricosum]